jgi:hypothetical protein
MASSTKAKGARTASAATSVAAKLRRVRELDQARAAELEQLQQIEKKSYQSRTRFWERGYLEAVYGVWRSWPLKEKKFFAKRMARLCKISPRASSHSIRIVIDCSSPKTAEKMRSRWTLALRYANLKRIEPTKLQEFFYKKGQGGLAGAASAYEARQRKAVAAKKSKVKSR